MKLKKIYINNFISFKECELDIESKGIVFIKGENKDTGGSNGAGKSSVLESIVWTLFGETVRGVDKVEDVINDKFNKDCMCRLDLEDDYTIVRCRKHKQYDNGLMLFHKDKNISKPNVTHTQKEINKLFNIDFDIFVNSIILAGSSIRANFLDSKNNTIRRQVIESILGIDKFADYSSTVKIKIKELESSKENMLLGIEQNKKQIKSYNDKLSEIKFKKEEFERDKEENIKTLSESLEKLSKIDVKQQLEIYKKINDGSSIKSKISGNIQALKTSVKDLNGKKFHISSNINKYSSLENKACEYCGSVLDQEKVKNMINSLEQESSKFDHQITSTNEKITQYIRMINEIDNELNSLQPELSEKELYNLEMEINVHKEGLERTKEEKFQDINFDSDIKDLVKTIKEYEDKLSEIDEELRYYGFWEVGFGNKGLKTYILDDMIKFLNKKIEFYLNILSKGQMHLIFDKFLDFNVSGLNYRSCSSGERKRVDLAVLIALFDLTNLRNKNNYNILILDEVLDSIDEIGVEAAQELLLELNKRIPTIFVISHNNMLSEYFPDVLTVVKENGISRIE